MPRIATGHLRGLSLLVLALTFSFALMTFEGSPLGPSPAAAATITVNTNDDSVTEGDSLCTLPEAMANAIADNGDQSDCAAGTGIDTIVFTSAVTTILLDTNSLPLINDPDQLTIDGGGDVTIDGDEGGIFQINGGFLALRNITVRDGEAGGTDGGAVFVIDGTAHIFDSTITSSGATSGAGGAIYNNGTLVVTDSTISDNHARSGAGIENNGNATLTRTTLSDNVATRDGGAIGNEGMLTIDDSIIRDNTAAVGGGIHNDGGTVEVTDTLFDNNEALDNPDQLLEGDGGAIYSEGGTRTVIVRDSTFFENTADNYGGAIANFDSSDLQVFTSTFDSNSACDEGGAIQNENAFATIENSTFHNNHAGEGFAIYTHAEAEGDEASLDLLNVTIAHSGQLQCAAPAVKPATNVVLGALYVGVGSGATNEATASHVIIAYTDGLGNNCSSNEDELVSEGWNLSDDDSCDPFFDHPSDISDLGADPELQPLDDNGGPTETMALLADSIATDSGNNATCADEDQRGVERPQDGDEDGSQICDRGAFELTDEAVEDEDDPTPTPVPTRTPTRTPTPTATPQPERGRLGAPIAGLFDAAGAARDARAGNDPTPRPTTAAPAAPSTAPAVVRPPSTGSAGLR